jgi:uncharacterized protein YjbI with pentapeptide repeats
MTSTMGRSPFRTIFLPAIATSGLCFAIVTLPISWLNVQPKWLNPHPVASSALDVSEVIPEKHAAKGLIRYIGLAIIASVGTGVSTAEVLRRLSKAVPKKQPESPLTQQQVVAALEQVKHTQIQAESAQELEADLARLIHTDRTLWKPLETSHLETPSVEPPVNLTLEPQVFVPGAHLQQQHLQSQILNHAHLEASNWTDSDLSKTQFNWAHLQNSCFLRANLSYVQAANSDLRGANLSQALLWATDFTAADLRGALLFDCDLQAARLHQAKLQGALSNLATQWPVEFDWQAAGVLLIAPGASLWGAELQGYSLIGVDLSKANLVGANLAKTDLWGANLSGADLSDANLVGANLWGANLAGANLTGADLTDAVLDEVIWA